MPASASIVEVKEEYYQHKEFEHKHREISVVQRMCKGEGITDKIRSGKRTGKLHCLCLGIFLANSIR